MSADDDVPLFRAPMRSRDDGVPDGAGVERGLRFGLCGMGGRLEGPPPSSLAEAVDAAAAQHDDRLARRIERFSDVPEGVFVWTRDIDGHYWPRATRGAVALRCLGRRAIGGSGARARLHVAIGADGPIERPRRSVGHLRARWPQLATHPVGDRRSGDRRPVGEVRRRPAQRNYPARAGSTNCSSASAHTSSRPIPSGSIRSTVSGRYTILTISWPPGWSPAAE